LKVLILDTDINLRGEIPLSQPFNSPPWNYTGSESVSAIPNANVVDWVLVELRNAVSPGAALSSTIISTQAAFLLNSGNIVGIDGSSILQFPSAFVSDKLYVTVLHRNHIAIMSANELSESGGVYMYNFSTAITRVYNGSAGYKEIAPGVYGMVGGDANADGNINADDETLWNNDAGTKGYKDTDFNLDGQVNNLDKNDTWSENDTYSSQVPE